MFNRYLTYYKPHKQSLAFSLLFFGCIIVTMLISILITPHITDGLSYLDLATSFNTNNPAIMSGMKILQIVADLFMILLPALLFGYLAYPQFHKYLGLYTPQKKIHWYWAIVLMLVAIPFISLLEQWNSLIPLSKGMQAAEEEARKITEQFLNGTSIPSLLYNLLLVALLPAVCEELLFRGCVQNILLVWLKKNPITAIVITAILFSLFHGQMAGFFPRMFAGVLLGLVYYYSGSILPSILMHFINNGISVVMYFLYHKGMVTEEALSGKVPFIFGLISALSCAVIIYLFQNNQVHYIVHQVEQDQEGEDMVINNQKNIL